LAEASSGEAHPSQNLNPSGVSVPHQGHITRRCTVGDRRSAGGSRNRDRVDLLAGLLRCVCRRRVRSDCTFADGRHRRLHRGLCEAWGPKACHVALLVEPGRRDERERCQSGAQVQLPRHAEAILDRAELPAEAGELRAGVDNTLATDLLFALHRSELYLAFIVECG
jgi:hypothetical protein